jgi:isochorismate synthase
MKLDSDRCNGGGQLSDEALLVAGLAAASRVRSWTAISLAVPVVEPAVLVAAWRASPLVVWSTSETTIVGIGAAAEVRGHGDTRWKDIVSSAGQVTLDERSRGGRLRWLGGLAFAPGAAEAGPWRAFGDAWFVLPRWTYICEGGDAKLVLAVDPTDANHRARWLEDLGALRGALASSFQPRPQPPMTMFDAGDTSAWRAEVRAITGAIARGQCAKIVAARRAMVTLAGDVRAADLLAELAGRNPECTRLLVRPPGGATFVAATPERLLRKRGNELACDALAGSHARDEVNLDRAHDELKASTKDGREHALVVDAISTVLRSMNAIVDVPATPQVRALRNVLHLHTPITATLSQRCHVLEVAARLHPTPAVGGTPTATATAWINAHEAPRGWYAAPVGWFDTEGDGELAVAIRSGLLVGANAHVWAGAGIVAGSDPDRELAETGLKLQAMLGALGVSA